MYRNLVLSGGSIKGLGSFVGCVKLLEEKKMLEKFTTLVGASAGAIVCFMVCCGMTSLQMGEFIQQEIERYNTHEIDVENLLSIFTTVGIDDGTFVYQTFEKILHSKFPNESDINFIQLAKSCGRHLVICGSNLTSHKTDYFSVDTTPDMSVLKALRISISLPFIFTPVIHNGSVYADAALFNNFPIDFIPEDAIKVTLGICIQNKNNDQDEPQCKMNLLHYLNMLVNATMYKMNEKPQSTHHIVTVIFDDDDPYNFNFASFKFEVNSTLIKSFINKGYNTFKLYLSNMCHEQIV